VSLNCLLLSSPSFFIFFCPLVSWLCTW
jgi:hypothetical protein